MTDDNRREFRLQRGADPEEEALQWFVRMTSGTMDDAEKAAFGRWRASPANAAAYEELGGLWDGVGELYARPDNVVAFGKRRRYRFRTWERRAAAIAATVAVFALSQQYLTYWQFDQTTRGSARGHAELADGSSVELNTGSAIDYDFSGKDRRVTLARGEAFFDVKRDTARPFVIRAGAGEVRVLGTAFSVAREGRGARVTVIRGKVRVSSGGRYVDIAPNQQVVFAGGAPQEVTSVDAKTLLAWSEGRLVMRDRPLAEVIDAIDRYYPGAIVLNDAEAGRRRVDAIINLDRIDEWLGQLQTSQDLEATRIPGVLFLG